MSSWPLYGSAIFAVETQLVTHDEKDVINYNKEINQIAMAVSIEKLFIINIHTAKIILTYDLNDVIRWGFSHNSLVVVITSYLGANNTNAVNDNTIKSNSNNDMSIKLTSSTITSEGYQKLFFTTKQGKEICVALEERVQRYKQKTPKNIRDVNIYNKF